MKPNFKIIALALTASLLLSLSAAAQWTSNATYVYLTAANIGKNVGIGTSTPHAQLQLGNTAVNRKIVLYESGNNNNQFYGFGVNSSALRYQVSGVAADHIFYAGNGAAASNELMRIKGDGRVGIGTGTPSATTKLHVRNGDFRLDRNGQFFDFKVDAAGNLVVERNGATAAMMIGDANGNVGIGTTTVPSAKLHVRNGDFRLDRDGQFFDFKVDAAGNLIVERNGSTTAMTIGDANGNMGLGGAVSNTYKLRVAGSAYATGSWVSSDRRYKANIQTFDNALEKVLALRGAAYTLRTDEFKDMNFNSGRQIGFIAQELQTVLPELVQEADGFLAVNYDGLVPVLVEAMKEQQTQIDQKDAAITALETRLAKIEQLLAQNAGGERGKTTMDAASDFGIFPNPSKGSFTVRFQGVEFGKSAVLLVLDMTGRELARQRVENGVSQAEVNLQGKPAGTYVCQLQVDGKVAASNQVLIVE